MKKIKKILTIFFFVPLILSSCGYQKIYEKDKKLINIVEFEVSGNKRIGSSLKNEILLISSSEGVNKFILKAKVDKNKEVKDKNISGKITKYNLKLEVNLSLKEVNSSRSLIRNFSQTNDYDVLKSHSDTLSTEKKLIENMTQQIGEDIINFLNIYVN